MVWFGLAVAAGLSSLAVLLQRARYEARIARLQRELAAHRAAQAETALRVHDEADKAVTGVMSAEQARQVTHAQEAAAGRRDGLDSGF